MTDTEPMEESYQPVPISFLTIFTNKVPTDIFIKVAASYVQVFKKNDPVDEKRIANYISKGVKVLFIRELDTSNYAAVLNKKINTSDWTKEKTAALLNTYFSESFRLIAPTNIIAQELLVKAKLEIESSGYDLILPQGPIVEAFGVLANRDPYLILHSCTVAMLTYGLALKQNPNRPPSEALQVALGGLLHDIGMSKIPAEINPRDTQLTIEEWETLRDHCDLGVEILGDFGNQYPKITEMIRQHHELSDGTGYPFGLNSEVIDKDASIVAFSDCLSMFIVPSEIRPYATLDDGLKLILAYSEKFDSDMLKQLVFADSETVEAA